MATILDRPGVFKAQPVNWEVSPSRDSQSVAIKIQLSILAQWDGSEWQSWADYEEHFVTGWWYVIGKNGQVNQTAVDQLVESLRWNGDVDNLRRDPPKAVVQVTVKEDTYNSKTTYKASWMTPEGVIPGAPSASPEDVAAVKTRYGSLLRAAAAGAAKKAGIAPAAPGKPPAAAQSRPPAQRAQQAAPEAPPPHDDVDANGQLVDSEGNIIF